MEAKSGGDLAYEAGEGRGQEPAGRLRAQAALSVRLGRSIDALRAETAKSAKRLERLPETAAAVQEGFRTIVAAGTAHNGGALYRLVAQAGG